MSCLPRPFRSVGTELL